MNRSSLRLDDIRIRTELKPGDMGYVTFMHGVLYKKEYGYGIQFENYVALGLSEFYQQYDSTTNRVWICEHDERMIGFMLLMNRGKAAQLRYFIIEPDYRGIGLGKKLMELYMQFLNSCGYESSYLWTTHELPTAASLYLRHGFRLTDEKPSSAFGKHVTEHRYDLQIK